MNKLEILTFLKRKNELFLKLNIDDILKMSSNVKDGMNAEDIILVDKNN